MKVLLKKSTVQILRQRKRLQHLFVGLSCEGFTIWTRPIISLLQAKYHLIEFNFQYLRASKQSEYHYKLFKYFTKNKFMQKETSKVNEEMWRNHLSKAGRALKIFRQLSSRREHCITSAPTDTDLAFPSFFLHCREYFSKISETTQCAFLSSELGLCSPR